MNLDPIRERALVLSKPISAEAPTGSSAKNLVAYEALIKEIGKLQSPAASTVDWQRVVESGREILGKNSKDLLIATYTTMGLYAQSGLEGLLEGTLALGDLMDKYWPTLYPEVARTRARVNALSWLIERATAVLSSPSVPRGDRDLLVALQQATERLAQVSRDKLANDSPGFGPLITVIEQLTLSTPEEKAPTPSTSPTAQGSTAASGAPGALTDAANAQGYLREVGGALTAAALLLRQANPANPAAYRLLRTGLWLHLDAPPAPGPDGKTALPPLPPARLAQLSAMETHGKWAELIEEAESSLAQFRFNLDLHRFTAKALEMLGPGFKGAREAVVAEVVSLTRRMPMVVDLVAQDGSSMASADTRAWLGEAIGPPAGSAQKADQSADEDQKLFAEAQSLAASGKYLEAVRAVQAQIEATAAGRARFTLQLFLAKLSADRGQPGVAKALFQALDEQGRQHGLDAWEPALAARCLEGLLRSARGDRPGGPLPPEYASYYQRLCRLSLPAALSTGG
jgi:type VI secretion system protein VasJ